MPRPRPAPTHLRRQLLCPIHHQLDSSPAATAPPPKVSSPIRWSRNWSRARERLHGGWPDVRCFVNRLFVAGERRRKQSTARCSPVSCRGTGSTRVVGRRLPSPDGRRTRPGGGWSTRPRPSGSLSGPRRPVPCIRVLAWMAYALSPDGTRLTFVRAYPDVETLVGHRDPGHRQRVGKHGAGIHAHNQRLSCHSVLGLARNARDMNDSPPAGRRMAAASCSLVKSSHRSRAARGRAPSIYVVNPGMAATFSG